MPRNTTSLSSSKNLIRFKMIKVNVRTWPRYVRSLGKVGFLAQNCSDNATTVGLIVVADCGATKAAFLMSIVVSAVSRRRRVMMPLVISSGSGRGGVMLPLVISAVSGRGGVMMPLVVSAVLERGRRSVDEEGRSLEVVRGGW